MTCACAIKQTFDCSFWSIHSIHFVFFKNYFKAVLPVPAKRRVNGWDKHVLDRFRCKELTSNSSQLHLLNEHGNLSFLLHISDHYIVGNNQGNCLKKIFSVNFYL